MCAVYTQQRTQIKLNNRARKIPIIFSFHLFVCCCYSQVRERKVKSRKEIIEFCFEWFILWHQSMLFKWIFQIVWGKKITHTIIAILSELNMKNVCAKLGIEAIWLTSKWFKAKSVRHDYINCRSKEKLFYEQKMCYSNFNVNEMCLILCK